MLSIGDCGIMLEPQLGMSMGELIRTARLAETLGFGYVFRSDHLLPTDDRRGIDSPECWTSLGAIAASTETIRFGPMVSPVGFRNPALLAKMACTLHSFSAGRLQLAVGAGWYEPEFKAHGYEFPTFSVRVGQFREAMKVILALVRDGRADFDGKYFSVHTDCLPRPSGRMHVIAGGRSKPTVRVAARMADEWNVLMSPVEQFQTLKREFDESSGGNKALVSEMGPFLLGTNRAELEENAKKQIAKFGQGISPEDLLKRIRGRNAPCGIVEEFVEQLGRKLDFGVQKFYFQALVPENTGMLELLADTLKNRF